MIPSKAPQNGETAKLKDMPSAVSSRPAVLKKRSDFLQAARALHQAKPGFILQMRQRKADELADRPDQMRVGFTCSKKVGNAVARNRAKRRLRAIAQLVLPQHGRAGIDYVLIGRKGMTAALPFTQMQQHLREALDKLHTRLK